MNIGSIKLTKKQTRLLISLALILLFSVLGYNQQEQLGQLLGANQPGLYRVTNFDDGDTITVDMNGRQERVRMIGVDTPELHHPEKPVQCYAQQASNYTKELIGENNVRLQADPLDDNRDLYGRLLRYVYLPNGTLVNLKLVQDGQGFAYTRFPYVRLAEFIRAESDAQSNSVGLWATCSVTDNGETKETNPLE